jgi:hypothetical protein
MKDVDLLEACKMAYKKHVLGDKSIGWDELSDAIFDAICNEIGSDGFTEWLAKQKRDTKR